MGVAVAKNTALLYISGDNPGGIVFVEDLA